MKKTIVELFFSDKHNATIVSVETVRFVYWHCSTLPPYKFERLIEKLKIEFPHFFVAALSHVFVDFFGDKKFKLISRINNGKLRAWSCMLSKRPFRKMIQQVCQSNSKKRLDDALIAEIPFKIEIKMIKYRVVFGLHYPEDYPSAIKPTQILHHLDKYVRNLFKFFDI